MRDARRTRRGQAIIMVTFALIAMCAIMGLAVDLGWAYFVKKSAQAAADAGALAAGKKAMDGAVNLTSYNCIGGNVACAAAPVPCPASGNLQSACLYAQLNGFDHAANPRQTVTVQASDQVTPPTVTGCTPLANYPPTAPCVDTYYWVTTRVSQSIPQLFSAILGNKTITSSARATAAVARAETIGSLILLNRQNDAWIPSTGGVETGTNLYLGGGPTVTVPGGILMASNTGPASPNAGPAGDINGNSSVDSPFTYVRTGGGIGGNHPDAWQAPATTHADGGLFYDPMRDKGGNPPISLPTNYVPVLGGAINQSVCPNNVCAPGIYYSVAPGKNGQLVSDGGQLTIANGIQFAGSSDGYSNFGEYILLGGASIQGAKVDFGPGVYVFAGVNAAGPVFNADNKANLTGGTAENSDPGRLFVFTDSSYGGQLTAAVDSIPQLKSWGYLGFGKVSIKAGNNAASQVSLYGLNPNNPDVKAAGLSDYGPLMMWQDQANSNVKYTDGKVDTSCGSMDSPCTNPNMGDKPQLELWATPYAKYGGVIYQPRGAWTVLQAAGQYTGPLRIITGSMEVQGNGDLVLTSPSTPIFTFVTALVE